MGKIARILVVFVICVSAAEASTPNPSDYVTQFTVRTVSVEPGVNCSMILSSGKLYYSVVGGGMFHCTYWPVNTTHQGLVKVIHGIQWVHLLDYDQKHKLHDYAYRVISMAG